MIFNQELNRTGYMIALSFLSLQGCEFNSLRSDLRVELASGATDITPKTIDAVVVDESCAPRSYSQVVANGNTRAFATKKKSYHYAYSSTFELNFSDTMLETRGSYSQISSKKIGHSDAAPYLNPMYARRELVFAGGDQQAHFTRLGLSGLKCSLLLVAQVKRFNADGSLASGVEFDPPLPYLIAPGETSDLQKAELGQEMETSEITATVFSIGPGTSLKVGQKYKTKVKISKVPARAGAPEASEETYKIEAKFGSPRQTVDLGIFPTSQWQVSAKHISAYSISTGGIINDNRLAVAQAEIVYK